MRAKQYYIVFDLFLQNNTLPNECLMFPFDYIFYFFTEQSILNTYLTPFENNEIQINQKVTYENAENDLRKNCRKYKVSLTQKYRKKKNSFCPKCRKSFLPLFRVIYIKTK